MEKLRASFDNGLDRVEKNYQEQLAAI